MNKSFVTILFSLLFLLIISCSDESSVSIQKESYDSKDEPIKKYSDNKDSLESSSCVLISSSSLDSLSSSEVLESSSSIITEEINIPKNIMEGDSCIHENKKVNIAEDSLFYCYKKTWHSLAKYRLDVHKEA